jgi:uncharacterized Fe-S center protein
MTTKVYFGSARQARADASETLPAKLDLILEKLNLRERVKGERVLLKMHTANNIGYSTIHPVFVRKVVQAIKDGGGQPFVADVSWDAAYAEHRGYSAEVLGCPVYPIAGPDEKYYYEHEYSYKGIEKWQVSGMAEDASFLVNFAHLKGHPSCSYGGALKNLALGCMGGRTRGQMHDAMHYDQYFFPEKIKSPDDLKRIIDACPFEAVVEDKHNPGHLHLHMEQCNQCGRCLKVAPEGSLKIQAVNFQTFMEACAISVKQTMSTFEAGKAVHLGLATFMTPLCDCFGFTTMPILPDAGVFGSDDMVALDQAMLDVTAKLKLIEDALPLSMEAVLPEGHHPFQRIHGQHKDPYKMTEFAEQYGLGSRQYELVDVFPLEKVERSSLPYTPSK